MRPNHCHAHWMTPVRTSCDSAKKALTMQLAGKGLEIAARAPDVVGEQRKHAAREVGLAVRVWKRCRRPWADKRRVQRPVHGWWHYQSDELLKPIQFKTSQDSRSG